MFVKPISQDTYECLCSSLASGSFQSLMFPESVGAASPCACAFKVRSIRPESATVADFTQDRRVSLRWRESHGVQEEFSSRNWSRMERWQPCEKNCESPVEKVSEILRKSSTTLGLVRARRCSVNYAESAYRCGSARPSGMLSNLWLLLSRVTRRRASERRGSRLYAALESRCHVANLLENNKKKKNCHSVEKRCLRVIQSTFPGRDFSLRHLWFLLIRRVRFYLNDK